MTLQPYHAGIVVDDIAKGADHLSQTLGYTFNPPTRLSVHEIEDRLSDVTGPVEMTVTYSREGPFRLELIEAQGAGLYAAHRSGLHHIGVWEPDIDERLRLLEESGEPIDAVLRHSNGSVTVIYAGPTDASGTRIEYVSDTERQRLERWFETGVLS